jgi:hypothetical protein
MNLIERLGMLLLLIAVTGLAMAQPSGGPAPAASPFFQSGANIQPVTNDLQLVMPGTVPGGGLGAGTGNFTGLGVNGTSVGVLNVAATWTATQTFGAKTQVGSVVENQGSAASGQLTIDGSGNLTIPLGSNNAVFWFTSNADFTLQQSGTCPGPITSINLVSIGDGNAHVQNWNTGSMIVQWPNNVPQPLTPDTAHKDIIFMMTIDTCATWQVGVSQNYGN